MFHPAAACNGGAWLSDGGAWLSDGGAWLSAGGIWLSAGGAWFLDSGVWLSDGGVWLSDSTSSSPLLLRGTLNYSIDTMSELTRQSATGNCE